MNKIKAFFKNILVRNLLVIGFLGVLILFVTECQLRKQTLNGEKITVPDFKGLVEADVKRMCEQRGLNYVINDTAFTKKLPKRAIVDQLPAGESMVKPGRTIYLTINSDKPPMITLKDLSNQMERGAIRILENAGFVVDPDSEYEPDPGLDWVLKIKVDDKEVDWETKLPKGTKVTLVLGDGSSDGRPLTAPDLMEMDYSLALSMLHMQNRLIGDIDSTELNDKIATAKIYKQDPRPGVIIKPNEPIHIWICDSITFNDLYRDKIEFYREPKDTTEAL
ncbi:MAG: PASTA domain-containing protein [Bacteroidia bacterium]